MNKKYIALVLAGMAIVFAGCVDELENQATKKYAGDEIVFGGRAGFEINESGSKKSATRTIYTGKSWTENGKTYEGVNWVKDDQVRIYCKESGGPSVADYTVTETETGVSQDTGNHGTTLEKNGAAGIQWGNTANAHTFYAIYPSPSQYISTEIAEGDVFNGEDAHVVGVIPGTQIHKGIYVKTEKIGNSDFATITSDGGQASVATNIPTEGDWHIVKPDMQYAYMVAKTVVGSPDDMGDNVYLQFMPIATAVEITLRNVAWKETANKGQTINLTSILVSSTDTDASGNLLPIYGGFDADLNTMDVTTDENGNGYSSDYPDVSVIASSKVSSGSSISLPMYSEGTKGNPLELKYGDAVTFTVFVLPTQDINKLNVTINGLQGSHTGTMSGIQVLKHKKTYLRRVPITGDVLPFDYGSWVRWIGDAALFRGLSIPGAGGAATYALTASDISESGLDVTAENVMQQTINIEDQWNAGVRCFEFSVDLNGTSTANSLGDSKVICSGVQMSLTLSEAVTEVKNMLIANPEEFAMIIVTYETSGGWSGTRTPATFMAQLNNYWTTVANDKVETEAGITVQTALYDPSTATVGDARGKLYCIARPTSIHLDYGDDVMIDVVEVGQQKTDGSGGYTYTASKYNTSSDFGPLTTAMLEAHGTRRDISRPKLECHDDILLIHGWGTLKDKWQQRGFSKYSVRRTVCNDPTTWSTRYHEGHYNAYNDASNGDEAVKNWLWTYTAYSPDMTAKGVAGNKDGKPGRPFDTSTMTKASSGVSWNGSYWSGTFPYPDLYQINTDELEPNFMYETSSGGYAWVQEWARVSNAGTDNSDAFSLSYPNSTSKKYAIYWANSYNEKLLRVKECLQYAQKKEKGDIVYINSLCGYYITNDYEESIYPCTFTDAAVNWFWGEIFSLSSSSVTAGMGGDIAGFATDINAAFYEYLLSIDTDYEAGSMGIVLMDRVGTDAGASIPGVIISNNFQFDLESEVNATMSLIDAESEDPQYAPATRTADGEEEFMVVWE